MVLKKLTPIVFFRASLVLTFLSLACLILLSLATIQSEKSLQVLPQIFLTRKESATLHEFSDLNTSVPMEIADREKIDEALVRYYLALRYEQVPDPKEMIYRWGKGGPLYLLSVPSVYNKFVGNLGKKIDSLGNSVKSIEIKKLKRKNYNFNVIFEVTFIIYEISYDDHLETKMKNATLTSRYATSRRRFSSYFTNPYGLIFTDFSESDVKSSTN